MLDIAKIPAAILAGGLATRLHPITQTIPKAMIDLNGKPFIQHQVELLHRHGVRKLVLCLGHLGEQVESHLGDGSRFDMRIYYAHDGPVLLGTGGAIRRAMPMLGEVCWVMYGDSYMDIDYRAILDTFARSDPERVLGLMTVIRNQDRWDRSNALFRDGRLMCYDKRNRTAEMEHIDYGVAILRRRAIERMPLGERCDLAELYSELVAERSMIGYELSQRFYEIGTPASLEEAREHLASRSDPSA